jgi:hypothetical protein
MVQLLWGEEGESETTAIAHTRCRLLVHTY